MITDYEDVQSRPCPGFRSEEENVEDIENNEKGVAASKDIDGGDLAIDEFLDEGECLHGDEKRDARVSEIVVSDIRHQKDQIHDRI